MHEDESKMTKPRVLIAAAFIKPDGEIDHRLREARLETVFSPWYGGRSEDELIRVLQGIDGVLVAGDRFTARVIRAADRLKVISRTGVGYDGVDVKAATERSIAVCTTPGVNRNAVADYTMALILLCARQMGANLTEIAKGGWTRHEGHDLDGSTLGIVGLGTIGKEVAKRARAFGMRVLAHDPARDEAFAREHQVTYLPLDELLRQSDYVSLHLFLNEKTRHLIHADRLALMKPTAYLINTARGGIVDTEALCEALRQKRIAGAALDVFDPEPLPADSPLRRLDNVYLFPHVAGQTANSARAMGMMAAENVVRVLRGESPVCTVNPEALKKM